MAAASTSFTFCPPDNRLIVPWVPMCDDECHDEFDDDDDDDSDDNDINDDNELQWWWF